MADSCGNLEPVGQMLEAIHFAATKHRDQRRKDPEKTPYINHPIGVAYILWKEGGVYDTDVLQVRSTTAKSKCTVASCFHYRPILCES